MNCSGDSRRGSRQQPDMVGRDVVEERIKRAKLPKTAGDVGLQMQQRTGGYSKYAIPRERPLISLAIGYLPKPSGGSKAALYPFTCYGT